VNDHLFDLTGRVALVTGGNSGIGLGMADALAMAGADVAIWGTNPDKNEKARTHLERHGTRVLDAVCDVGDEDQVESAMAATIEQLGKVDSCFANAGVGGQAAGFLELSVEEWRRVMRVNLDGTFFTLKAAVRHMVERGEGGSVAVTTSTSTVHGMPRTQNYSSSKAAIVSLVKGIAVEFARHGIRANSILPGWIETDMTAPAFGWDRFVEKVLPRVPMRRWGRPDDFGGVAVYLASEMSAYHTGDTFVIDGGYTIF
jgi:NAD(P)-dependent dehydrogenase (short-subunit alcohol dehydrogenase family)